MLLTLQLLTNTYNLNPDNSCLISNVLYPLLCPSLIEWTEYNVLRGENPGASRIDPQKDNRQIANGGQKGSRRTNLLEGKILLNDFSNIRIKNLIISLLTKLVENRCKPPAVTPIKV